MKDLLERVLIVAIVETYFQKILEGVNISEVFCQMFLSQFCIQEV